MAVTAVATEGAGAEASWGSVTIYWALLACASSVLPRDFSLEYIQYKA